MAKFDINKAIRIIALYDVANDEGDFLLRKVHRWYSSTFHTPLWQVSQLPQDHVLKHYWESYYESKKDDVEDESEWQYFFEQELKHMFLPKEDTTKKKVQEEKDVLDLINSAKKELDDVNTGKKIVTAPVKKQELTMGGTLPDTKELEELPEVKMDFISDQEMDSLMDSLDLLGLPKKDQS